MSTKQNTYFCREIRKFDLLLNDTSTLWVIMCQFLKKGRKMTEDLEKMKKKRNEACGVIKSVGKNLLTVQNVPYFN